MTDTITRRIERTERHEGTSWPYEEYTIRVLECGHAADDSGEDAPTSGLVPCKRCGWDAAALGQILMAKADGRLSHVTLRDMTASKTGEWMSYCAYERNPESPTGVTLIATCSETKFTTEALRAAGIIAIPGPSRGRFAM